MAREEAEHANKRILEEAKNTAQHELIQYLTRKNADQEKQITDLIEMVQQLLNVKEVEQDSEDEQSTTNMKSIRGLRLNVESPIQLGDRESTPVISLFEATIVATTFKMGHQICMTIANIRSAMKSTTAQFARDMETNLDIIIVKQPSIDITSMAFILDLNAITIPPELRHFRRWTRVAKQWGNPTLSIIDWNRTLDQCLCKLVLISGFRKTSVLDGYADKTPTWLWGVISMSSVLEFVSRMHRLRIDSQLFEGLLERKDKIAIIAKLPKTIKEFLHRNSDIMDKRMSLDQPLDNLLTTASSVEQALVITNFHATINETSQARQAEMMKASRDDSSATIQELQARIAVIVSSGMKTMFSTVKKSDGHCCFKFHP